MRSVPWIAVLLALTAGCGRKDEVRHYKAPKDPMWRMLGAIAPMKDATWFFKVIAPSERVAQHKPEVLSFLGSLRSGEGKIRWTLPPGWQEEKGAPEREASFSFGDREPKLELAVSRLAGDGGGLAANVNRWRGQLGLESAGSTEMTSLLQKVSGPDFEVLLVDLTGPTRPGPGPMAMSKPVERPPPSRESPIAFELPSGWKENPQPSQGRRLEFSVEDGGGTALVTLTGLSGEAGGLAANIDRWRTQAGLEPLGELAVARSATPMTFVGLEAWLAEAIGKDRAILGVLVIDPKSSLFLKMDGPPSVVIAQRSNFTRFAQSFRMRGRNE
jgi:hypothetical protein